MSNTILVSNRLPVRMDAEGHPERTEGGLASGLMGAGIDALWVGWPGSASEAIGDVETMRQRFRKLNVEPVFLSEHELDTYYEGYSNGTLWPLLHSMVSRVAVDPEWFANYEAVNRRFAAAVLDHAKPGDTVWIHDFHLLLLPKLLREAGRSLRIGFFLHTPFPASELFRILPEREALLMGLLGADLIGFHTFSYLRHFRSTLLRVLGIESEIDSVRRGDHVARLGVHPIGHDHAGFAKALASDSFTQSLADHKAQLGSRRLVLGVERLDYTKGIPQKLAAIRQFLTAYPEWHKQAIFVLIAVPSRQGISEYDELTEEVQREVGAINGMFGAIGYVPVQFLHQGFPQTELAALYALADVCVVTPLIDGMNLVAKEFIACKSVCPTAKPGALVLSEFAGAANEMSDALLVNPHDVGSVAAAIAMALAMKDDERTRRTEAMGPRLVRNDARAWARKFLQELETSTLVTNASQKLDSLHEVVDSLTKAVRSGQRIALFLDYDGTLRDFTGNPSEAVPGIGLRELLRDLAAHQLVHVAIVSGRPGDFLERHLDGLGLDLVCEHGYRWLRVGSNEWQFVHPGVDTSWIDLVRPVFERAVDNTPGSSLEEKRSALVWHYRRADPEFGVWCANNLLSSLTDVTASLPVVVHHGRKIVEVASQLVSKGAVVRRLMGEYTPAMSLVVGDDQTDETMFALQEDPEISLQTVCVGEGPSRARWRSDIVGLRQLLEELRTQLNA
tara:strand:- start:41175 stop:43370 length:2196 start_codon:yes stop_codon:yes gene_type:complete